MRDVHHGPLLPRYDVGKHLQLCTIINTLESFVDHQKIWSVKNHARKQDHSPNAKCKVIACCREHGMQSIWQDANHVLQAGHLQCPLKSIRGYIAPKRDVLKHGAWDDLIF